MTVSAKYIDGNGLAGPFSEIFVAELTGASTTCVACGRQSAIAQLHVYMSGPGAVARCPGCEATVLRYARTADCAVLDLRGTLSLSIPVG
jgi:Family of unknown function (DUF6510)